MTSMTRRMGTVAAMLLVSGVTLGCSGGSTSGPPPATAASAGASDDDEVAAGLMEHHRHHHHGGVTLFIAMSLDTLGVSAEQQAAVEKIRTELHARMEAARIAEQSLVSSFIHGASGRTKATQKRSSMTSSATWPRHTGPLMNPIMVNSASSSMKR